MDRIYVLRGQGSISPGGAYHGFLLVLPKWRCLASPCVENVTAVNQRRWWADRGRTGERRPCVVVDIDGMPVNLIDLQHLKANKQATGRHQDLADLENLA